MSISVGYDSSVLTLESVNDGGLFGEGNAYFGNDTTADPYVLMWEDGLATENHMADGTLATLTFLVAEDAQPGDTEISVTVDTDSTLDVDLQQVQFNTQSGIMTITDTTPSDSAVISVGTMKATAGTQIAVPIRIHNNPGLVAMLLTVSYDASILTLTGAEDGEIFGDGNAYFCNNYADNPYVLMWEDALSQSNHTADGVLAVLSFNVSEKAAEGQTAITLSVDDESTFDVNLDTVDIAIHNGIVTVESAEVPQGTPSISIGNVIGRAGETVQVPITIQNNPGLIAARFSISYDADTLTLIDVEDGELFGVGNAYFGNDYSAMPYTLLWEDALSEINHTGNGTLAVMTFAVADDAYGNETKIELQYDPGSFFDVDLQDVTVELQDGKVTVVHKTPTGNKLRIFSFDGSFETKVDWWRKYSSETKMLGFLVYGCDDAVRYVWSTNSWRVDIDQKGNITNTGPFARSAKITLTAYDAEDNVVASSTVTVRFYKFNWQYRRLQLQEIVSDNILGNTVSTKGNEAEPVAALISVIVTNIMKWLGIKNF